MNDNKNIFDYLSEWQHARQAKQQKSPRHASRWLPSPGNVIFTLVMIGLLILTQRTWASNSQSANTPGPSTTTINYQGRLADDAGNPQTGTLGMSFAIWDAANGGGIIWGPENHSAVPVTDGLFNVGLGSQTSGGIPTTVWNGDRYLEITVGGETLTPRELIRSVPVAGMALTAQTADTALTANSADLALSVSNNSVTSASITDGTIVQADAPSLIKSANGNNRIIREGNVVVAGTDSNGFATINYPCFPNGVSTFLAINAHWDANHTYVVGHNAAGQCSTVIKMSSSTSSSVRISWIAIGN